MTTPRITSPLRVEILDDGRTGRLTEPLFFTAWGGEGHIVPACFETDFASTPRFLWRLIPPWGPYSRAAVVHDYLYRGGRLGGRYVTRRFADSLFFTHMRVLGVCRVKAWVIWAGVRVGGRYAWRGK